jgi:hypothetical protein
MSTRETARLAGFSYLFIILFGIFSHIIVRGNIVVSNDSARTATNILNQESLFRMSIISDLLMVLSYLALGIFLYFLFKPVHKKSSTFLLLLNVIGASMMALNMTNQFIALYLLKGSPYLNAFDINQLQAASLFFMNLHAIGYKMATISYGLWLIPMGHLGLKSKYFPKIISYLLVIGGTSYMISFFGTLLGAQIPSDITIPADLGEFSLCFWLLFRGVKES